MTMMTIPGPEGRAADPGLQLEVDELMLDYLLYMATRSLIEKRLAQLEKRVPSTESQSDPQLHLGMVDSFLQVFKANHPTHVTTAEIKFRLKLLQYTTLFTQRFERSPATPSRADLKEIRSRSQHRSALHLPNPIVAAELGIADDSDELSDKFAHSISRRDVQRRRQRILANQHVPGSTGFYGSPDCPSLLDTLEEFMKVSAAVATTPGDQTVSTDWMHLAAHYMLQAALEMYLVWGDSSNSIRRVSFAWGHYQPIRDGETEDDKRINDMFWGIHGEFEDEWRGIEAQYLQLLIPRRGERKSSAHVRGEEYLDQLEKVAQKFPMHKFEVQLLNFLRGLQGSSERPVLAQLESGKLEGSSTEETEQFMKRCGL